VNTSGLASQARHLVGRRAVWVEETASTNDLAFAALEREGDAASGMAIFADRQTAGRGRRGRRWESRSARGLLFSVAIRAAPEPPPPAALVAASAVAMRETIATVSGLTATIKWPNDLLVEGRKVCGILVEARSSAARTDLAVGIGLNVNDRPEDLGPELRETATSLAAASNREIERELVARIALDRLDARLSAALLGDLSDIEACFLVGLERARRRVELELGDRRADGILIGFECSRGIELDLGSRRVWFPSESVDRIL
jgi:BirA family transcriptional regulator, biotin operon repressor / biotin---[acetyl-CoA-carboxylase] ligase